MRFLILLFCPLLTFAQQLELELIRRVPLPLEADLFTADQYNDLYVVFREELIKISTGGEENYSFSEPLLGVIQGVDALNPMSPLVFYDDVNQLRILDNRLNESRRFDLLDAGFIDPILVAYSDQNNVWLYDQIQDQLLRYDLFNERVTAKSQVITPIVENENLPSQLFCSFDRVILRIPGEGALVFDAQGAFLNRIPLETETLLAFDNRQLLSYHPEMGLVQLIPLDGQKKQRAIWRESEVTSIAFENERLFLLGKKNISIIALKAK